MASRVFLGVILALSVAVSGTARATLLGGPSPITTFGGPVNYSYLGPSAPTFTIGGVVTLQITIATYGDTFGTSQTDQSSQNAVFTNSTDTAGATRTIATASAPFVFYFKTVGTNQLANCDPSNGSDCAATLFTNGTTAGAAGGNDGGQTDLAVYYAASTNTYAMFFDDGGIYGLTNGVPNDDNDYNDLVVTYTPAAVPEPFSIALLGSVLIGLGLFRVLDLRKRSSKLTA